MAPRRVEYLPCGMAGRPGQARPCCLTACGAGVHRRTTRSGSTGSSARRARRPLRARRSSLKSLSLRCPMVRRSGQRAPHTHTCMRRSVTVRCAPRRIRVVVALLTTAAAAGQYHFYGPCCKRLPSLHPFPPCVCVVDLVLTGSPALQRVVFCSSQTLSRRTARRMAWSCAHAWPRKPTRCSGSRRPSPPGTPR